MNPIRLGNVQGGDPYCPHLELDPDLLFEHMTVIGKTGTGKTRFLNGLIGDLSDRGIAVVVIDFDGDLCEDVLAHGAKRAMIKGPSAFRRLHYLEPSPKQTFALDPFDFHLPKPLHPEVRFSARWAWLHTKVQCVVDVFQRKQGQMDTEGMPRLQRVFTNVLTAAGLEVDGRRLSVADAGILIDLGHPMHFPVFNAIAPRLPRHILADFEVLHAFRRPDDVRKETESTLNRLRSMFGPLMQAIFSRTDGPAFNLHQAVQKGETVLVNLRESPFFAGEQALALGTLMVYETIANAIMTPRDMRKPCILIIDEAAEIVTPDMAKILRRGRKYKLGAVYSTQSLDSFIRKDYDLTSMALSQPSTVVCFNQRWPKDVETLSRTLFTKQLRFTPLVQEVERDGGIEFIPVTEYSEAFSYNSTWSDTESDQVGETDGEQHGHASARQKTWQKGKTKQVTASNSEAHTETASESDGRGSHESPVMNGFEIEKMFHLGSTQRTNTRGVSHQRGRVNGTGLGESEGEGGGETDTINDVISKARSHTKGRTHGEGGGDSQGITISHRFAQVQKVVREIQKTGQLEQSVADQVEEFGQVIYSLAKRHAVALCGTDASLIMTLDVPDPFASPEALVKAVEWAKRELAQLRDYLFVPNLDPAEQEARLRRFLGEEPPPALADEPVMVGGDNEEVANNAYGY
jgi:hypothetical protein